MKAVAFYNGKKCVLFHRWENMSKSTTITDYFICRDCAGRKIVQETSVYQPVDWDFLRISNGN